VGSRSCVEPYKNTHCRMSSNVLSIITNKPRKHKLGKANEANLKSQTLLLTNLILCSVFQKFLYQYLLQLFYPHILNFNFIWIAAVQHILHIYMLVTRVTTLAPIVNIYLVAEHCSGLFIKYIYHCYAVHGSDWYFPLSSYSAYWKDTFFISDHTSILREFNRGTPHQINTEKRNFQLYPLRI
jgi:hypothetical protein